jgi:GT2 family glycosyltransferase
MDITTAVISYNTRELTETCIESLLAQQPECRSEVVIVDNGSNDGSRALAEGFVGRGGVARVIANDTNTGYAAACNQAVRAAAGRHILILNADTLVRPGALDALVEFMDSHPGTGIAAPKLLYPDGRLQVSTANEMNLWTIFLQQTLLDRLRVFGKYFLLDWDHDSVRDVPQASGAALCVRREVFDAVGLFDEGYFMYCEDTDFELRASRAGWKITYVPSAEISHYLGHSSSGDRHAMVIAYNRSIVRFFRKFRGPAAALVAKLLTLAGAKIRLIGWGLLCLFPPRTQTAWAKTKLFARVWIGTLRGPWGIRRIGALR